MPSAQIAMGHIIEKTPKIPQNIHLKGFNKGSRAVERVWGSAKIQERFPGAASQTLFSFAQNTLRVQVEPS